MDVEDNNGAEQPEEYVAELVDESKNPPDSPTEPQPSAAEQSPEGPALDPPAANPAPTYSPAVAGPATVREPVAGGASNAARSKPPEALENLAAKGGAVGAMVLGVMALLGSFITSYAVLNALLGLLMGLWGLSSDHQRMAGVGMVLCLISAFFCAANVSSWLGS